MTEENKDKRIEVLNKMKNKLHEIKTLYKLYMESRQERWESDASIETGLFDVDIDFYGRQNEYEQSFNEVLDCLIKGVELKLKREYEVN